MRCWCGCFILAAMWVRNPVLLPTGHHWHQKPGTGLCRFPCRVTCRSCSFPLCLPGHGPTQHLSEDTTWSQESRLQRRYSGESKECSTWTFERRAGEDIPAGATSWSLLASSCAGWGQKCCLPLTDLKDLSIFYRWGRVSLSSPQPDTAQQS